jgi:hypothetical protein
VPLSCIVAEPIYFFLIVCFDIMSPLFLFSNLLYLFLAGSSSRYY